MFAITISDNQYTTALAACDSLPNVSRFTLMNYYIAVKYIKNGTKLPPELQSWLEGYWGCTIEPTEYISESGQLHYGFNAIFETQSDAIMFKLTG